MAAVDDAHQVDVDDPAPILQRHVADQARDRDPGVVHHQIGAAKTRLHVLGQGLHLLGVTHVAAQDLGLSAQRAHRGRGRFGAGQIDVADEDLPLFLGQNFGEGAPEPAACTGDDRSKPVHEAV